MGTGTIGVDESLTCAAFAARRRAPACRRPSEATRSEKFGVVARTDSHSWCALRAASVAASATRVFEWASISAARMESALSLASEAAAASSRAWAASRASCARCEFVAPESWAALQAVDIDFATALLCRDAARDTAASARARRTEMDEVPFIPAATLSMHPRPKLLVEAPANHEQWEEFSSNKSF